jgi:GNAT superfamily N-acetyltransferase
VAVDTQIKILGMAEKAKEFACKGSEIYQGDLPDVAKEHQLIIVQNMISIRPAVENDIEALYSVALIAQHENERREFIRRAVASGECFVAVADEEVIGYAVLNYTFYHNGFIEMLYIRSDFRRSGAGAALLQQIESLCETPKLFTSTNLSNLPMQSLLAKLGYILSGVIHNLDEDDPEIVYFKQLR